MCVPFFLVAVTLDVKRTKKEEKLSEKRKRLYTVTHYDIMSDYAFVATLKVGLLSFTMVLEFLVLLPLFTAIACAFVRHCMSSYNPILDADGVLVAIVVIPEDREGTRGEKES